MKILVSNDDGVHAPGIQALARELLRLGDVTVVAPLEEKSTTGHSLTIHKPLRLIPIRPRFYGVNGSPADCVYLGVREVLKSTPDLVISGINRGANMGQDVYYSGTVSAAREASILGIPSMAVSLDVDFMRPSDEARLHYATAAKIAVKVIRHFLKRRGGLRMPLHTLYNLNVPDLPLSRVKGITLARQGFRFYSGSLLRRTDHRGKDYYWVGGKYEGYKKEKGTDCAEVAKGFAALTPLMLDSTNFSCLSELSENWTLG